MTALLSRLLVLLGSLLLIATKLTAGFELPFMGSCTIKDEKCHRQYCEKFFEMYGHGIPELDVATMEPMNFGDININGNSNANFNLAFTMQDVKLYNYSDVKCLGVKGFSDDPTKPSHVVIKFRTPELKIHSHCKIKGKLLLFNVAGDTDLEVFIKNITTTMGIEAYPYEKDSEYYFKLGKFTPKLIIGSLKMKFSNSTLFNGDKAIMDSFTDTMNENWMALRDEIEPHLNAANLRVSKAILNKLLLTMPLSRWFKKENP